jgi:uncharacterized membrane protein
MRSGKGNSPADSHRSASRESGALGAGVAQSANRYDRLDALRGLALIWMAAFHFCFDLSNYHLLDANFYSDALWLNQRTAILSLFLLCAGAGQALATTQGQSWPRFWRRWAQIVGCAALVSLGSWFMFPNSFIYFGVLHGMGVMLIVARLTAPLRVWLWPLGLLAIALPHLVADPFFDTRLTNWLGLVTQKPITEDYVPILPWLGVMWWGLAGTQWILAHRPGLLSFADVARPGHPFESGDNAVLAFMLRKFRIGLAQLGRWSLTFYMVHQPVLIGCLLAWMALTGRQTP